MEIDSLDPIHQPPTYTPSQLLSALRRISFPTPLYTTTTDPTTSLELLDIHSIPPTLQTLTNLIQHAQSSIPFENLSLHYSAEKHVSLDATDLFGKIVNRRRGGYCMENNHFFGTVLRSLGYTVMSAGGRVSGAISGAETYTGLTHMVNIVTVENQRYLVDIGFGNDEAVGPLPLVDGFVGVGIGPRRQKLEYKALAQHTDKSQRVWVYSFEDVNDTSSEEGGKEHAKWIPAYSFVDFEFFPADYEIMNYGTSTKKTSFFTYNVMCTVMLLGEGEEDVSKPRGLVGYIVLFGDRVKKRIGGKVEVIEELNSEEERVAALEKYFGIVLSERERKGIRGTMTQIRTKPGEMRTPSRR